MPRSTTRTRPTLEVIPGHWGYVMRHFGLTSAESDTLWRVLRRCGHKRAHGLATDFLLLDGSLGLASDRQLFDRLCTVVAPPKRLIETLWLLVEVGGADPAVVRRIEAKALPTIDKFGHWMVLYSERPTFEVPGTQDVGSDVPMPCFTTLRP